MKKWQALMLALVLICNICMAILLFSNDGQYEAEAETMLIKEGMRGSEVKKVQAKLRDLGYFKNTVDGIFGWRTKKAVKNFQKAKGLKADGIVGKATRKALGLGTGSSSNSGYNESDVYLLAKCIYAESRGEPYVGQVAVGAVVLNRVRSSDFPNSIAGVIYQPWAFTAVNDGQINLEPNESARKAAKDAMSGWDPTHGCLYYYNPAKTTNKWIWSREVRLVIGRHRFAV